MPQKIVLFCLLLAMQALPALAGDPACTHNSERGLVTLAPDNFGELRRSGRAIHFRTNPNASYQPCGDATVGNTDTIRVLDRTDEALELFVNLSSGALAPGRTTEGRGRSEIETRVKGQGAGDGPFRLTLEGTDGPDFLGVGERGAKWNGDGDLDIHAPGVTLASLLAGPGQDEVNLDDVAGGFSAEADPNAFASGGKGSDLVVGSESDDFLFGGGGHDRVVGKQGRDRMRGLDGPDIVSGGKGRDEIMGNKGNDKLDGDKGDDYLAGHGGQDLLDGDEGHDRCLGGLAVDQYRRCERRN